MPASEDRPAHRDKTWAKAQAETVVERLSSEYDADGTVLSYKNDWELLVAIILSAQSTDKMVNQVTAELFPKYPALEDYASADPRAFEDDIRSTGFFRNKTKHILGAARRILDEYGGEVPHTMKDLLTLPGVARKTANVFLGNADPQAYAEDPDAGIAVDTHVHRLSRRLGLSTASQPDKTERELMEIVPRKDWFRLTYLLISHGRAVCTARKPQCGRCDLQDICPSAFAF